jgi:hypothetical protein
MYQQGYGVPENNAKAANWFRQAAEQGLASAQYNLGVMYQHGTGVAKDEIEGLAWFILAAASGDRISIEYRDQTESALGRDATLAAVQRSNKILEEIEAETRR